MTNDKSKQLPHKKHMSRICYINANGLKTEHSDKLQEITTYMAENEIDIFGITETNLNTNDTNIYQQLTTEIRKHLKDKNAHITASVTKISTTTKYKPGDTAIITRKDITSQTMIRDYDNLYGRWTTVILGPPNHQVTIITAYIV